jgi:purine-binding chemotaxis protein CheW
MTTEEQILKERARLIAQKKDEADQSAEAISLIEFLLFPERYAIESVYVREVLTISEVTEIPGTPSYLLGVINYRGSILSVINLKVLLGLNERGLTEMNKVLLLSNGKMEFGLVADGIFGSSEIHFDQISAAPINVSTVGATFISGVLKNGSILLNGSQLLDSESLIVNHKTK